jgi:ABC-type multidrug transport system fused ATPase/permease subunit
MGLCLSLIGLFVAYSCYGWGVYRLWQGAISYGTMTLFLQISGQLTGSFSSLVSLVPGAISVATSAGRIMEITDLSLEENKDSKLAEKIENTANEHGLTIVCDNLKYTYPDGDEPVVGQASFRVSPGETVAFVGPSGEGKTTLLRLILGLVEPDSGELTIQTKEGIKIPVSESTRRFCAYVPQGNAIFSGTVADNLRIVCPEATDEELIEALKVADAWNFVSELPLGLNTEISEKGVNFSEGQVQRMSIARAILRDAPIVVMDEATSALDAETEEKVLTNMMKTYPNRARIITTHRPSMLQYCTRIYKIVDNGILIEDK